MEATFSWLSAVTHSHTFGPKVMTDTLPPSHFTGPGSSHAHGPMHAASVIQ